MRGKVLVAGITAVAAAALGLVGVSPAGAADSDFFFSGDAAGARVYALDGTTSGVSAESGVFGGPSPQGNSKSAIGTTMQGVVSLGGANTSTQIKAISGGWRVVATAQTTGFSLLNGAIKATSITTTAAIDEVGDKLTTSVWHNDVNGAKTIMSSKVATINLFSGLIKAQAITANASAGSDGNVAGTTDVVSLTIAGKSIALLASPNTEIHVPNLHQPADQDPDRHHGHRSGRRPGHDPQQPARRRRGAGCVRGGSRDLINWPVALGDAHRPQLAG